ncbi:MAG TPA: FG-GAP-like repeat-containing protein [Candidatus Eisenbacteria bacterium]
MLHPLRRSPAPVFVLAALLAAVAALLLLAPPAAEGQYLYLDANGDGAWSAADLLAPSGATTIDVWIQTDRNRDGSPAVCASGDGDLTMSGYQVVLAATNGTVAWGAPVNQRAEFPVDYGTVSGGSEITVGFGGGATLAPGAYRLCTVTASVAAGTPAIGFAVSSALSPGFVTGFSSSCSGVDLDNLIKLGSDFQDADGIAYGGVANHPPVLEPIADVTVPEGTTLDVPVTATDADGDAPAFALVSGPSYASLLVTISPGPGSASTGVHLAPGYEDAGDASATVSASDAFATASETFAIHVPDVNRAPVMIQPTDMMATEGVPLDTAIEADDPDGDRMSFFLVSGPSFATVTTLSSDLGTARGNVHLNPGYADAGMVVITAGVRDASLTDQKSWTLMVRNVDRPPVLTEPASVATTEGERLEFDAVSVDPDGEIASLTASGLPAGATFVDRMDGTARFDWVPGYGTAGEYSVAVTADDRAGYPATGTTTITVAAATGPIGLAQPDDMPVVAGHAASQDLLARDADGSPLTFALDSGPSFASVKTLDPGSGVARGLFTADASAAPPGVTGVSVSVSDGVNRAARSFTLTIVDPATLPGRTPFAPPFRTVGTGLTPHTVTMADVDGDGILDLVTANLGSNSVSYYHGFGDLTFDVRRNFPTGMNPHTVIARDLNHDGILDLAMSEMGGHTIGSLRGLGQGAFAPLEECPLLGAPMYLGVEDFDRDGNLDAVATDLTNGTLATFRGNGDGTFTRGEEYATGANAHGLVIGDVNGDGRADVVVANPGSGTVSVLIGRGDGTFEPKPDFTTSSPHTLNLGDLDGDGILDLLVVNFDTGTISILRGVGDGTFTDRQDVATGANAHGGAIADLDGDGIPDILVANQTAGTLSVLMGRGAMRFAPKTDFAVAGGAHSVAVGDLDQDGDLDVAVSGITGNAVTILENRTPPTRAARAFPAADDRTLLLRSGKPMWTLRIEPVGGDFRIEDIVPPVQLVSEGTGTVGRVSSSARVWVAGDADRNGVPDVGAAFAKEDLRALFGDVRGRRVVTATVEGTLLDGARLRAAVEIDLIGGGPPGRPQVAPNPINPSGTLSFTMERAGAVTIGIYDVRGRRVRRLLDGARFDPGEHRVAIDGQDERGKPLASGIYFFRIETGEDVRSGRFAVLK